MVGSPGRRCTTRDAPARKVVIRDSLMTLCEAPCEPACDRPAVSTVQWRGHPIRVCQGHRKRERLGQPLHEPLAARRTGVPAEETFVMVGVRVHPDVKIDLEQAAKRRGLSGPSEATREALAYWLASSADEVRAKLSDEANAEDAPASSRPRR